ncbi:MAG: hypothetical protein A3J48_04395 [Candidatus Doudnabacteria bacterium RIFCSPHIGHO2_02_FULL_46_11]|uniref:Uncharacterized protein n=1 Tax=Candidatus Doudnabacteria bacterium RIFCSPHIGHO2_02_FULL_46_11 TaxID=1817832 RepID=A0A1F5P471_9BACT|nr:MAG: hypothetical protein A3J48_04395 [Candidatus Doudnabacteria bacterium RIFCSPHIGHO2_02_FULL_46_11]
MLRISVAEKEYSQCLTKIPRLLLLKEHSLKLLAKLLQQQLLAKPLVRKSKKSSMRSSFFIEILTVRMRSPVVNRRFYAALGLRRF